MAKKVKGVTWISRNGARYWYARVDGQRVYCEKGDKAYKVAVAARSKHVAKQYENREVIAGLKVKRVELKTVTDMANWYMQLPKIQQQKCYPRKVNACSHLFGHFANRRVYDVQSDDIEKYRLSRTRKEAAEGNVNIEVILLSAMYNAARKAKRIHADMLPGEFLTVEDNNPRPKVEDNLFEKLQEQAADDFADFLVCGYESAMRSNEICELRA